MKKDRIERICREAGMRPEKRARLRDVEVFVADGFSLMPHRAYRKFGVDADEFPNGMYVTLWWISKDTEKLDIGQPLFFDARHNPELDAASKKLARIAAAIEEADKFLMSRKRMH